MIRPLRIRHRRMIAGAAVLIAIVAWLALREPRREAVVDSLPAVLVP